MNCEKRNDPETPQIVLRNCAHTLIEDNRSDKPDALTVRDKSNR